MGFSRFFLYTAVIIALAKPMGAFMAKVFAGERTWLHRIFRPVETAIYKICGIDELPSSTGRATQAQCSHSARSACSSPT
jgi:K+-transporting ATPase A subunit